MRESVAGQLKSGELVEALKGWSVGYSGDFLYYPSRRTLTPALRVLIEHLRYQGREGQARI